MYKPVDIEELSDNQVCRLRKVLNTTGEVADVVGLGVCRKHEAPVKARKARKTKRDEGFLSD
jgi:hypothetical protein